MLDHNISLTIKNLYIPCTVALAPTADANPIVPATKYPKTLFVVGDDLEAYFPKLGIFRVELVS
jgi:hypothetical protein